jgi:hypothetical protein
VGAFHWLKPNAENDFSNQGLPPLVLLLRNTGKLMVVTFLFEDEHGRPIKDPKGSVLSLPFPGQGVTMGDLGSGNLMFVSQRRGTERNTVTLKLFVMQQLEPTAIVESLAREHKYEEAISAAQKLDEMDQAALAEVVEQAWGKAAPATWNRNRAAVSSFLSWCTKNRYLAPALPPSLERRAEHPDETRALSRSAIERQLSRRDVSLREKTLWRMLYETAARASEILALDIAMARPFGTHCP